MSEIIFNPANIIGGVALIVMILSFQQRDDKTILIMQIISTFLFALHFALKGAYTGTALNVISSLRALVFFNKDKKWASGRWWVYLFIAVSIISGVLTWKNILCIFPMIAMVFTSIGFRCKKASHIRLLTLPNSPLWLIHNALLAHSVFAVVTDICCFTSTLVGILRYDIPKKAAAKQ